VKFIFGISGESVACSSSCVGIYIFGDFLVGFHLQSSVFLFCFRECHCSLSLPIPSVSTEVAPLYFFNQFLLLTREGKISVIVSLKNQSSKRPN